MSSTPDWFRIWRKSSACLLRIPLTVHLERLGSLPEETVRYYVAEISSALSFLHERKIIHRYLTFMHYLLKPALLTFRTVT